MTYKEQKKEIFEYAKKAIEEKYTKTEEFIGDFWFRKMNDNHNFIVGNKYYVFHVKHVYDKYYMNKIY